MNNIALNELRRRANALAAPAQLRRFAKLLAADSRAGARALAQQLLQRAQAIQQERRRMAELLALRNKLQLEGARCIAGVDEVGVGALAGPVVAAAVVLPQRPELPGLNDSKKLSPAQRETLAAALHQQARAAAVGLADAQEVDEMNVYNAGLLAMRRAVLALPAAAAPDHLLVDARRIPNVTAAQSAIIGGDARDASIAAASVVAKVHRDALMREYAARYPGYGFAQHKGYGTRAHLQCLQTHGPSPIHRRSYAPVAKAVKALN